MAEIIEVIEKEVIVADVAETSGAATGTMIVKTHNVSDPNQHTIEAITGLKDRLQSIESLKNTLYAKKIGHADYYLCGAEKVEPGYFVRLDENGCLCKCTNGSTLIEENLTLDKDDSGRVVIYALAGNITTKDPNKYYVVGTESPYKIFAYDGIQYIQKPAYCYKNGKVYKTCANDILGVTVDSAGFVGNNNNIDNMYSLVATTGSVDVFCFTDVVAGDYVYPGADGWAARSDGFYGYLVNKVNTNSSPRRATISLTPSVVNTKQVADNVEYLLAETQRIGENVVKAVSDAETALNSVREAGDVLSGRVDGIDDAMSAIGEQLQANTVTVDAANNKAIEAEKIANQAKEYVDEVVATAGVDASGALSQANTALTEVKELSEEMRTLTEYKDPTTGEVIGVAGYVAKSDEDGAILGEIVKWKDDDATGYAATVNKVTSQQASIDRLTDFETDTKSTLAQIKQISDENGSVITALTSKIDRYSVGEYSQAYGLTQAQAADILEAGKIVFIPTDFVSGDAKFTEHYNPEVLETWDDADKNTKYIYEVGDNYYYHKGTSWVSDTIDNMQLAGYCKATFNEHYSYVWDGRKWIPETNSINVFFDDDVPVGIASVSPLYWVVGSGCTDDRYKIGALYIYDTEWKECALGSSNSMSRMNALVEQTQNSWKLAVTSIKGDMAAIQNTVNDHGARIGMVASVTTEVPGIKENMYPDGATQNIKIYSSKEELENQGPMLNAYYYVVGSYSPYKIYTYNEGSYYEKNKSWYYDGYRVLKPNAASIITAVNESGDSAIQLDANYINFNALKTKISSDVIDLDGSVVISGLTEKVDATIVEQVPEYSLSSSNTKYIPVKDGSGNDYGWHESCPSEEVASNRFIWRRYKLTKSGGDIAYSPKECITPKDGENGTSVKIIGTASSIQPVSGGYYLLWYQPKDAEEPNVVVAGEIGDGYIYAGKLYTCVIVDDDDESADLFIEAGEIQGPEGKPGVDGKDGANIQYIYALSNSVQENGENPEVSDYSWKNKPIIYYTNGDGLEGEVPESIGFDFTDDNFIPRGWSDKPNGITEDAPYEWISQRIKPAGSTEWGKFSNPTIWSKWGDKGRDGGTFASVETQYYLTQDKDYTPKNSDNGWSKNPTGWKSGDIIWTREHFTMTNGLPDQYSEPTRNESATTIASWCYENDKTIINGGNIATGSIAADSIVAKSITAKQIEAGTITADELNTNAIKSKGYKNNDTGSFLNLADGSFDSKNFKIDSNGDVTASNITLTGGSIKSSNYVKFEKKAKPAEINALRNNHDGLDINTVYYAQYFDSQDNVIQYDYIMFDQGSGEWLFYEERTSLPQSPGSFLNLADGSFDSQNFKIDSDGNVIASNMTLTNGVIDTENFKVYENGSVEVGNFSISKDSGFVGLDGDNTGTKLDYDELSFYRYNNKVGGFHISNDNANFHVSNSDFSFSCGGTEQSPQAGFILQNEGMDKNVAIKVTLHGYRNGSWSDYAYWLSLYTDDQHATTPHTFDRDLQFSVQMEKTIKDSNAWLGDKQTDTNKFKTLRFVIKAGAKKSDTITGTNGLVEGSDFNDYDIRARICMNGIDKNGDGTFSLENDELIEANWSDWGNVCHLYEETSMVNQFTLISNKMYFLTKEVKIGAVKFFSSLLPSDTDGNYNLGEPGFAWNNLFIKGNGFNETGSNIILSDRNCKNSIEPLANEYSTIFDNLVPVTYKYNGGTSDRTHTGFIAQDVKSAIENAGLTTKEFAGYCEWEDNDGNVTCGIRYEELIALCVKEIQDLKKEVKDLKEEVKALKGE